MKKHSVDDLFSRKLRDAEVTPREETYQKLQQRMQSKQRRLGWWQQEPWLAAAGVSLLLLAGWVVWNNNNSEEALTAQVMPKTESIIKQKLTQIGNPKVVEENLIDKKEITNQQSLRENQLAHTEPMKDTKKSSKEESSLPILKSELNQITQVKEIAENALPLLPVNTQETQKAVAQASAINEELKTTEKTVVLQLPELQQSLVAANEKETVENNTSTPSVESTNSRFDESILNQPRKSTRMAKVWKQLKNAKNGEKVDWDEVGFNPNKLLAKATGKNL